MYNFRYIYTVVFYIVHIVQEKELTSARASKQVFQVYGCVMTSENIIAHKDHEQVFDKVCKPFYMFYYDLVPNLIV